MPIPGILTLGWQNARDGSRATGLFEMLSAAAAAALLTASTASTAATVLEQSALSDEPARAERADGGSAALASGLAVRIAARPAAP